MPWGKASATKWLIALLFISFLLGLASVISLSLGLVSAKAQGQGTCYPKPPKDYVGLGRWDDGPPELHLNWHVCELYPHGKENYSEKGWKRFGDSWYQAFCGWHRWEVAEKQCVELGNAAYAECHLASVNSKQENEFVQQLCGYETCWIGLSESNHSEDWFWPKFSDGKSKKLGHKGEWDAYTNWNEYEPNNWRGVDENVGFMNAWMRLDMPDPTVDAGQCGTPDAPAQPRMEPTGSGKWFDISSDFRIQYSICEKPKKVGPCEEGWSTDKKDLEKGSCYRLHCGMHDLPEAVDACKSVGATLVSINDLEENKFIRQMCGINSCRIGLFKDSRGWHWADGTSLGWQYEWQGFVNWNDGEPNNWGGAETAGIMNSNDIGFAVRKGMLFAKLSPIFGIWSLLELGGPIVLLLATCIAAKSHSACLASCIRSTTGMAGCWLACLIVVWIMLLRTVSDVWPEGSRTLLIALAVLAIVQTIVCCMASARAQELQWSTTLPWSAMGAREVGEDNPGVALSEDVRGPPASA